MPSLAGARSSGGSAKPAMKSAMVKPMPASMPPPASAGHPTPSGKSREPGPDREPARGDDAERLAEHEPGRDGDRRPIGTSRRSNATPAFASAKIGMIAKLTQGCSRSSRYSSGEIASRAAATIEPMRAGRSSASVPCARRDRGRSRGEERGRRRGGHERPAGRQETEQRRRRWSRGRPSGGSRARRRGRRARTRRTTARRAAAGRRRARGAPPRRRASAGLRSPVAVAERDHEDRTDVVGDRERQQHDPEAVRHARAEQRHAADDERDVGRHRDAPAACGGSRAREERGRCRRARPCRRARRRSAVRALRGSRSSPTTSSRFTSSPTTKKKIAIRPSLIQCSSESWSVWVPSETPSSVSQRWWYAGPSDELASASATAVHTSKTMPPAASTWRKRVSGSSSRAIGAVGSAGSP